MSELVHRPRRLRRREGVRALVREARLAPEDLILPLFACPGEGVRREVSSMPGVFNLSTDQVAREAAAAFDAGVPAVILFGLPESKDETASGAYARRGVVQEAARAVRLAAPEMVVVADTCLCEYTSHGHCGVVRGGEVLNDESLELLAPHALARAREQRQDQILRRQTRLAHQRPHALAPPQPPRPVDKLTHELPLS